MKESDTPVAWPCLHQKSLRTRRFLCYITVLALSCIVLCVMIFVLVVFVCRARHHERSQCHDDGRCRYVVIL